MGRNFTSLDDAEPGDFLKIWWNDNIGYTEKGHSVVFLGRGHTEEGEPTVSFWSANLGVGYGEKSVPLSRIKRVLVSRLENPEAIARVVDLPKKDAYLAELMQRPSSEAEVCAKVGLEQGWPRIVDAGPAKRPAAAQVAGSGGSAPTAVRAPNQAPGLSNRSDVNGRRKAAPAVSPAASPKASPSAAKKPWFKKIIPL
jgi:hypothetical protein